MHAVHFPQTPRHRRTHYPASDGLPLAENTLQFQWIVTLKENLDALVPDFVAGDLLWYPVEGDNKTRAAPDAMVALGRPKGHRGSYRQWEEAGVAPQVVFEVLSPGNTFPEMYRKLLFYERYGVQEYYLYDPDNAVFTGYRRQEGRLVEIDPVDGWTSPLLGVRFQLGDELQIFAPDGRRFLTFAEQKRQAEDAQHKAEEAQHMAEEAQRQLRAERERAEAMAARLRALGIEPD